MGAKIKAGGQLGNRWKQLIVTDKEVSTQYIPTSHCNLKLNTLGDKNMADNIMEPEINGGLKYGGIPEKPPHFTLPNK